MFCVEYVHTMLKLTNSVMHLEACVYKQMKCIIVIYIIRFINMEWQVSCAYLLVLEVLASNT